ARTRTNAKACSTGYQRASTKPAAPRVPNDGNTRTARVVDGGAGQNQRTALAPKAAPATTKPPVARSADNFASLFKCSASLSPHAACGQMLLDLCSFTSARIPK